MEDLAQVSGFDFVNTMSQEAIEFYSEVTAYWAKEGNLTAYNSSNWGTSVPSKTDPKNAVRLTHDGAVIEGYGVGGQVVIVQKSPEFMRDIAPYFAPSFIIIFAHIVYVYTGNLLLPIWLMYLACPIVNIVC